MKEAFGVDVHANELAPVLRLSCTGTPLKSRPLLPPSVTLAGFALSVALVSVIVTFTVLLNVDPPDEACRLIEELWVPKASAPFAGLTLTPSGSDAVPLGRFRTSQESAGLAVQLKAAPLFIVIFSDCDASVAPLTPENVRLSELA